MICGKLEPVKELKGKLAEIYIHETDHVFAVTDLKHYMTEKRTEEALIAGSYNELQGEPPLSFVSGGSSLQELCIYGKSGGVGNYDESSQKYLIPITVKGKNVLINRLTNQTYNGLTLTVNNDKSITVNGTASATTTFYICDGSHRVSNAILQEIDNGSYLISGAPEGAEENNFVLSYLYKKTLTTTSQTVRVPAGEEVVIDNSSGDYHFFAVSFTVWSGITVNDVTFRPMLRAAGTTSDYEQQFENTVTISLDSPLGVGDCAALESTGVSVPLNIGTNNLTAGTTVQPIIYIKYQA